MNLYSTIMSARRLKVNVRIRAKKSQKDKLVDPSSPDYEAPRLYKKWESRMTKQISLIYDPVTALTLEPTGYMDSNYQVRQQLTSVMPIQMSYQFAGILRRIEKSIIQDGWFRSIDGTTQLVNEEVEKIARKLSLPRENTILILPTLIQDQFEGRTYRGVQIQNTHGTIGYLTHQEMLSLIDTIDHLDITTYTLLAGIADQIDSIDGKVTEIDNKLDQLIKMIQKGELKHERNQQEGPHLRTDGLDRWEALSSGGQTIGRSDPEAWTKGIQEGNRLSLQYPALEIHAPVPGDH